MLETFTSNNSSDFNQRYCGTYGWLLKNGSRRLVYLENIYDDILYFNVGNENDSYYAKINSGTFFEFIPVNKGWFNSNNDRCYFLCRKPARQWKRGISPNNTTIYDPLYGGHIDITYNVLSSIFNLDYTKYNYPLEFKKGALSNHFCLDKNNVLFFYEAPIGFYDAVGKQFILNNDLVAQELKDLISRNNWNIEVSYG